MLTLKDSVNILGTEYKVEIRSMDEDCRLEDSDGICDNSVKEIVLARLIPDKTSKKDLGKYQQKVIRHEIVHAFLSESGLGECSDWAQNEELVDWIAVQGLKIYKAWKEVGAV